jgi:hypothetical protein
VRRQSVEPFAPEGDLAGSQGQKAHNALDRRRLAGTVAADQADDLVCANSE